MSLFTKRERREQELLEELEKRDFAGALAFLVGLIIDLEEEVEKLDNEAGMHRRIGH